jgi:flagellar hook capping protein FlgD
MSRRFAAVLFVFGAAFVAGPAGAEFPDRTSGPDISPMLVNARIAREMTSRAMALGTSTHLSDTTWVGYNPAYAGSNYWSVGVGHRWPRGTYGASKSDIVPVPNDDTGYWDWDHPVHGDTLQGWWPIRHLYTRFATEGQNDKLRPWHAVDIGNQISYVINQGPGYRRTFGVTSAWHSDPGVSTKVPDPGPTKGDVNPNPPRWTPIAGARSAWCGLRAHGDIAVVDPITGNPYNVDALEGVSTGNPNTPVGDGWTGRRYPGYASQWDQMLYRDVDISSTTAFPSGSFLSVTFSYRTRMSTGKGTWHTTETGWFDKDPLAVVAGNFISSSDAGANAPIDSLMLYAGRPVGDAAGSLWTGSDGLATHQVFDPIRRWFGELIRANEAGGYYELFGTFGDDPPILAPADSNNHVTTTVTRNVTYGTLRSQWGSRIRLVFRVKTNRGFDDDSGSILSVAYNSGYLGAAQIDQVFINGASAVYLGGFENQSDIDNDPGVSALSKWKTSSKPPPITFHVHALSDLLYQDLCGPPGAPTRLCDLAGNVISMGDHDLGEAASGPVGTAEQEHFQGMFSPTINLAYNPGNPTSKNNMGLNADTAVPTAGFAIAYNIYAGYFDLRSYGQSWQWFFQSYPATQSDGTRMWGEAQVPREAYFDPLTQCFDVITGPAIYGRVRTSNPGGQPDSIRIGLRKLSQCYRFGLTTLCGSTLGGYFDNVSLGLIDGPPQAVFALPWDLYHDSFPSNETAGLPGLAQFDTTSALMKSGLNIAPLAGGATRYDSPGDSCVVEAGGDEVEVQIRFRIRPGPGNYVIPGDECSGLRRVPADTTRIKSTDLTDPSINPIAKFWTAYILNPGKEEEPFPTLGRCGGPSGILRHDQRWAALRWCNAIMDTAETNLFPVHHRGISLVSVGLYATTYREDDPHLPSLGISRHICFMVNPGTQPDNTGITCSAVPCWVYNPICGWGGYMATGWDGHAFTVEGTKIIPDGLLTPGSSVEYYFVRKDLVTGEVSTCPDPNRVYPQPGEYNFDAHRWQQFSVLPDAWKFSSYGGLGKACMLYVDWADRRGDERIWVSVADSIGATQGSRIGAHNGWVATSDKSADINDPSHFVDLNAQPGTTWDMYGVKAAESVDTPAGTLGARSSYHNPGSFLDQKWAKNAPTLEMLEVYYRILLILSGDVSSHAITGPFPDQTSDDTDVIRSFLVGASASSHRGLWCMGSDYVEDLDYNGNVTMAGLLNVSLRANSYLAFSGNSRECIDLIPTSVITTNGDIYGIRNTCLQTLDVLEPQGDGVAASYYDPVGANPANAQYVAGVFTDAEPAGNPDNHWQTLVDGWETAALRSRLCDKSYGRLAYFLNVFTNVFGKVCAVAGTGPQTVEVPNNHNGSAFVDFAEIGNNPLRQGSAAIHLSLGQADRVTVRIYDVSGRLVRTLANGQLFHAGRVDPSLTWDGLDDRGRRVARGAYFVSVRYQVSRFETTRRMIVLR